AGDAQARAENVVQVLLLGSEVLALSSDPQAERVTVEVDAPLGVRHYDRRVVDAEEKSIGVYRPLGGALVGWKLKYLERLAVRGLEVERGDPRRARDGFG